MTYFSLFKRRRSAHCALLSHIVNIPTLNIAPTPWNSLPKEIIRFSQSASSFKSASKTHLFPNMILTGVCVCVCVGEVGGGGGGNEREFQLYKSTLVRCRQICQFLMCKHLIYS